MRVNDIFYSVQGEGVHTGVPAVFVRFSGCNRHCPFCDTDFSSFTEMSEAEIVDAVCGFQARTVVITGGEPALQLTASLVDCLHEVGRRVHVETNGSLPLPANVDWVTCSPKEPPFAVEHINELKLLFTEGVNPDEVAALLPSADAYCLQPVWGSDATPVFSYVLAHPRWRLSLQTHKFIDIP